MKVLNLQGKLCTRLCNYALGYVIMYWAMYLCNFKTKLDYSSFIKRDTPPPPP